jgi:type IX secretion system PorP/SprF family membrane protein
MKNIVRIIVLVCIANTLSAQQIPLTSQYMFNNYLLNPAEAGATEYIPVSLSVRQQWAGLDGAPETQFFSMHSKLGEKMGVGGYVYRDETGPISEQGLQLSYAYHLSINDKSKISFSLAGLLFFHSINRASLKPEETGDETLSAMKINAMSPDINFGILYYTDKYKVGISSPQLLQNSIYSSNSNDTENSSDLARHYYLFGEYSFSISDNIDVVPSTLVKYVSGAPFQGDLNVRGVYQKKYWIGASYRYNNAVVGLLGLNYKKLSFGYAYDFTLTDVNDYSSGGHELFLSYKIFKKEVESAKKFD